jgi:hypothetical protein
MDDWKDIPGYEGRYQASRDGRVRSIHARTKPKQLSPYKSKIGYWHVKLIGSDARRRTRSLHRCVLSAFTGVPMNDPRDCNHIDLNKDNNNLKNLEWVTKKKNHRHAQDNGAFDKLKRSRRRLSFAQAEELRKLRGEGWLFRELGEKYGMTPGAARNVVIGNSYRTQLAQEEE